MEIENTNSTNINIYDTKEGNPNSKNILFKPTFSNIDEDTNEVDNNQQINNQLDRPYDIMNNSRSIITKSSMMTYSKM